MGFLSKFIEVEEKEEPIFKLDDGEISAPIEVNLPDEIGKTLIFDIYSENQISDMSQSIFKVEELINSLPKEMPTVAKLSSVRAILANFGISCDVVSEDAQKRISILSSAFSDISGKTHEIISEKEHRIESLKEEIAKLEKEISEQDAVFQSSKQLIDEEVFRIEKLNEFIAGGND